MDDSLRHGYANPLYAWSLAECATPLALPHSGAMLLTAAIGNTGYRDAFGPYPLFSMERPEALGGELEGLAGEFVSVYTVTDPLRDEQLPHLESAFDSVHPYKPHYIVDLRIPFASYMRRHHRRYVKRGLEQVEVTCLEDPLSCLDEWTILYENLCERHQITGLRRFSRTSFASQLAVKGCSYFRATHQGEPVGGLICYLDRGRAYAHLVAASGTGQSLCAQYALYWTAIEHYRSEARHFDLGGAPGPGSGPQDGLTFFKSGWASETRMAHFCARVLDRKAYDSLIGMRGRTDNFPAYRRGILGAD